MKKVLLIKLFLLFSICSINPSIADIDSGIKSFHAEDYASALTEFTKLAENGDSNAQYWLGCESRMAVVVAAPMALFRQPAPGRDWG